MAYFPNGTAGMVYEEKYCYFCVHQDEENGCPVMDAHLLYAYELCNKKRHPGKVILDMLIPMQKGGLFPERCKMWHPKGKDPRQKGLFNE